MSAALGPWLRRGAAVIGAVLFVAIIAVSTERARPAATPFGRAIGIVPTEQRLADIADEIAVAHRRPAVAEIAFARSAALGSPLDPLPYYIVGATQAPHATAQARALVAMALRRDPRLRSAWSWTVDDRVQARDTAGLTRALLRLAVLNRDNVQLWSAVAQISADPVARSVITREIRNGAPWRMTYFNALSASPVDRSVVFEMLQSVGQQAPVTNVPSTGQPAGQRAFMSELLARKEYERAYLAWLLWLPKGSQSAVGYVFDSMFEGKAALLPFNWDLSNGAGGTVLIDPRSGLSLDYSGADNTVIAQQMLLIPPGRYRLKTQAKFDAVSTESGVAPLAWSLSCLPDGKPLSDLSVPLEAVERRVAGAPFDVATGCEAQNLMLKVNSVDFAKHFSGTIRSISIEAVK